MRVRARVCAYMCVCMEIGIRTHDHDKRTNGTQDTRGREETTGKGSNTGKPEYIGIIASTEKKVQKKLKKFGNIKRPLYLCIVIKQQTSLTHKITKQ